MTKKGALITMIAAGTILLGAVVSYASQPIESMRELSFFNALCGIGVLSSGVTLALASKEFGQIPRGQEMPQAEDAIADAARSNRVAIWVNRTARESERKI